MTNLFPSPVADQLDQQASTYRSYLTQTTSDVAQARRQASLLASYRLAAPGLPAGTYQSFASQGVPPDQVAQLQSSYIATPSSNTVQYQPNTQVKKKSGGGLFDAVGNAVGDVAGAVGEGLGLVPGASWVGQEIAKPVVRWGSAALATPIETLTNVGVSLIHNPSQFTASLADDFHGTTLGQMFVEQRAGQGVGTGWLPPQQARADAAVVQRAVRGTIDGHAATFGRVFANAIGLDPGSVPYDLASGAVDLAATAKLDPVNWIGKEFRAAAELHSTFAAAGDIGRYADAGAFTGVRKYFNPQLFSDWIDGRDGRIFSSAMSGITSPAEVRARMLNRGTPQVWKALAEADTPEAVAQVMNDAVENGLRDVPKVGTVLGPGGASYAIRRTLRDVRLANLVPAGIIDPNNQQQALQAIDRAAANARLGWTIREDLQNRLIDAAASPDPMAFKQTLYGVNRDLWAHTQRAVAGEGWWDGADGRALASSVLNVAKSRAAGGQDPTGDIRTALEATFPQASFSDRFVNDIAHAAAGGTSTEERAQRLLDGISMANPELSWVDDRAPEAAPLRTLIKPGTTVNDVRGWLGTAFPAATWEDNDVRQLARIAAGTDADRTDRVLELLRGEVPLGRAHLDPAAAKTITRYSRADTLDNGQFFVKAGAPDSVPTIHLGAGAAEPIVGPHLWDEMLNSTIELPDYRTIRRTNSMFANLFRADDVNGRPMFSLLTRDDGQARALVNIFDGISQLWRTAAVTRGALFTRILGDQQLRLAADGLDSFVNHPIRAFAHVLAGKDSVDVTGAPFLDDVNDVRNDFSRALGANARGVARYDRQFAGQFARLTPDNSRFVDWWGYELNQLAADRVAPAVAKALAADDPTGELAAVADRFYGGNLDYYRQGLMRAEDPLNPSWRSALGERAGSDAYINTVADRIGEKTVGDRDLIQAVADGKYAGKATGNGVRLSDELRTKLQDMHADGTTPAIVKGRVSYGLHSPQGLTKFLDKMYDTAWRTFVTVPSSKLTAVPAAQQLYAQEVARLVPEYEGGWKGVLDAIEHGDTTPIQAAIDGGPSHLTAAEVDAMGRTHVVNTLSKYTYDLHNRAQITDLLRTIIPFGEVFRQEMTKWARLSADNLPTVLHRSTQAIVNARSSGFFFTDPQTHQEMFHIPIPFVGAAGDPGMEFAAPVSGLNIIGQGLPGVGAVAAVPVDQILKHVPNGDALRKELEPYGPPDFSGTGYAGVFTQFLPSFAQKALSAYHADPQNDRMFASMFNSVLDYNQTAHPEKYPDTPAGRQALHDDSIATTRRMMAIRSFAQFVLPAAPQANQRIKVGDKWVELAKMGGDYRTMLDNAYNSGGNVNTATAEFLQRYGTQAALIMVPQSVPTVYGLSATTQMGDFQKTHRGFVRDYADVWPLFAPPTAAAQGEGDKGFSYFDYVRQREDGDRVALPWDQRLDLADYRIGSALYDRYRAQVPTAPDQAQRAWLAVVRQKIAEAYPGWGNNNGQYPANIPTKVPTNIAVRQVAAAAQNPAVADTPAAQAVRLYDQYRTEAATAIGEDPNAPTPFTAQKAEASRAWLRDIATRLAVAFPGFGTIYENVYSREAEDPIAQVVAA